MSEPAALPKALPKAAPDRFVPRNPIPAGARLEPMADPAALKTTDASSSQFPEMNKRVPVGVATSLQN